MIARRGCGRGSYVHLGKGYFNLLETLRVVIGALGLVGCLSASVPRWFEEPEDGYCYAPALGLPAIIFLRPDNLTSLLDPCMMVVLRLFEYNRVENYSRKERICFVTKLSRKLVYDYKSVVDALC